MKKWLLLLLILGFNNVSLCMQRHGVNELTMTITLGGAVGFRPGQTIEKIVTNKQGVKEIVKQEVANDLMGNMPDDVALAKDFGFPLTSDNNEETDVFYHITNVQFTGDKKETLNWGLRSGDHRTDNKDTCLPRQCNQQFPRYLSLKTINQLITQGKKCTHTTPDGMLSAKSEKMSPCVLNITINKPADAFGILTYKDETYTQETYSRSNSPTQGQSQNDGSVFSYPNIAIGVLSIATIALLCYIYKLQRA